MKYIVQPSFEDCPFFIRSCITLIIPMNKKATYNNCR